MALRTNERTTVMARTRRIKDDRGAHYHVMSRTNDRRFLFEKGRIKKEVIDILRRSADFSGVRLEAYCLMDDHFHVVCHVAKPDEPVPEDEVIRRIGVLKGGQFAADLAVRWSELRSCGLGAIVDASLKSWRARMNDVSQFAKTFKELVSIAYKASVRGSAGWDLRLRSVCVGHSPSARVPACGTPGSCGSIWSGRFKSTLIEDGRYLATCIRYVELNPVRAGMVRHAKDYAYSSANDAKPCNDSGSAGSVPDGWLMARVAQVGDGKIFGSRAFVMRAICGFGWCFAGRPTARPVFAGVSRGGTFGFARSASGIRPRLGSLQDGFPQECGAMEGCYASHGYKLAGKAA